MTSWSHQSLLGSDVCDTSLGVKPEESAPSTLAVTESSHSLNLARVSSTVRLNWLPLCADWWAPWSSADCEEDLRSMWCSCTMGLWLTGSVPDKRSVTWTLSRPTSHEHFQCLCGGGWLKLKVGFSIHPKR